MPTLITHAIIGGSAAIALASNSSWDRTTKYEIAFLSVLCSVIPDADVSAFALDIPYGHTFGHRGFFHSLLFALLLGLATSCLFPRQAPVLSRRWFLLAAYFCTLSCSHGLLDACTQGGLGVALLSPFDTTRYRFSYAPFTAAPLSLHQMFTPWGARVLRMELVLLWVPALLVVLWCRWRGRAPSSPP
jgi:inner membrane protein